MPAIRVRFAVSDWAAPCRRARSALFNWAVAEQTGGTFVLCIEDTDRERSRPEWAQAIIHALDWIGIRPGSYEGPYPQSERAGRHRAAAQQLYCSGRAYYCDCPRAAHQAHRQLHRGYDGFCRQRGLGPGAGPGAAVSHPDEGETVVADVVRGAPTFPNATLEDFVIARGDGQT